MSVALPAATSLIALFFAVALLDQWRERRQPFQAVWALGMLFFGTASGCEALAGASGWSEPLYRTWYLTGAVWTAGWLGLGTAFLLGRTRFGYAFALGLVLAGLFTLLTQRRFEDPGAGSTPILYFIAAGILAIAIAVETYFQNDRWPRLAALAVAGATLLSVGLMVTTSLPAPGYAVDPATGVPTAVLFPGSLRLLTPFPQRDGGVSLALGAILLGLRLHAQAPHPGLLPRPRPEGRRVPVQPGHLGGGLPGQLRGLAAGAVRAFAAGRLHSRVAAPSSSRRASGLLRRLLHLRQHRLLLLGQFLRDLPVRGLPVSVEAIATPVPFTRVVFAIAAPTPAPSLRRRAVDSVP